MPLFPGLEHLANAERDPCTCAGGAWCAVCIAYEQGSVLWQGEHLCSTADWHLAHPRAEARAFFETLDQMPPERAPAPNSRQQRYFRPGWTHYE